MAIKSIPLLNGISLEDVRLKTMLPLTSTSNSRWASLNRNTGPSSGWSSGDRLVCNWYIGWLLGHVTGINRCTSGVVNMKLLTVQTTSPFSNCLTQQLLTARNVIKTSVLISFFCSFIAPENDWLVPGPATVYSRLTVVIFFLSFFFYSY